jgi:hypothetical protein
MEYSAMPKNPTIPKIQVYLALAAVILSAGIEVICVVERAGEWSMLPLASGVLSLFLLFRKLKERRRQVRARQHLVQTYVDRLLLAQTPEERQPILDEMKSRQFLKGISLSSSDLEDLDLSFADFSEADLSGATLSGANLTGANLTGATLSYATLSYTTLQGAILKGANLRGVNLRGADLRQTDLRDAFLRGAVLVQATLTGAMLQNAQLHTANLQDADLREADLGAAVLTRATLPNGATWETCTDMDRFTNPSHTDFWRAEQPYWFVYPPRHLR